MSSYDISRFGCCYGFICHCNSLIDGNALGPVALAVSSSLPARPVNPVSVVNIDNKDDENIVLDIGNYPIVADPIAPET